MSSAIPARFFPRLLLPSTTVGRYMRKFRRMLLVGALALLTVDLLDVVLPLLVMLAIDVVSGQNKDYSLTFCAFAYVGLILTQGFLRLLYRYNLSRSNVGSGDDLRRTFCMSLFSAPVSAVERERAGDLVARASSDVDAVSGVFDQGLITLFDAIFYLIAVPIIMFTLSWKLALVALLPLPLIPLLVVRNDRKIRERYRESQQHLSALSALAQESVIGGRVIKSFSAESAIGSRYLAIGGKYVNSMLKLAKTESLFGPALEAVVAVSMLLVLLVGGTWAISGVVTLGTFIALQRYTQQLLWPMQAVGIAIGLYQRAAASSDRTEAVLAIPPEASGTLDPASGTSAAPLVEFENVSFGYSQSGPPVLQHVSFSVLSGETVAIVGDTASGKSTLLSLIPKLYEASSGTVRVFSEDVKAWDLKRLRGAVAFVSQDVFVLSGPIAENIALSSNEGLAERQIEEASKIASLHLEIARLPHGYQTLLGERGINLSGGQRQRLSIARAVAKQAPLLILDDVFSSVDSATEAAIREALRERSSSQARIIVSHRLSTVQSADKIVVLEAGRVTQCGRHRDLVAADGWYSRFCEEQRLVEDLERYSRGLHERHS